MLDPQLSPGGKDALVRIVDATAEGGRSHLWLIPIEGDKAPRQLTHSTSSDEEGESQGQWLPDGSGILFVAKFQGRAELFRLPLGSRESHSYRRSVSFADDTASGEVPIRVIDNAEAWSDNLAPDVVSYRVSPDGRWIAVAARIREASPNELQQESKTDELWVDHGAARTQLYLVESATSNVRTVPVAPNVRGFSWSDDASRLLVLTDSFGEPAFLGPAVSGWVFDVRDWTTERIASIPTTAQSAIWAAGGRSVIVQAQALQESPPLYPDLYLFNLDDRSTRDLTEGFGGSIARGLEPIALTGDRVMQVVQDGLDLRIAVWRPGAREPAYIALPLPVATQVATNRLRNGWLFLASGAARPPQLLYARRLNATPHPLATPPLQPAQSKSGESQRIRWRNDGWDIEGIVYLPLNTSERAPVPLVVDVHGGPTGAFADRYDPFVDFMIGHGWALLRVNPRGSIGRGAAFAAANRNDLGGGDYRDIMAGVDCLIQKRLVDPTRLALIGYSYGGEMAAFAEGRTQRFKAIVSASPVIDQISQYGSQSSYPSFADEWFSGKPWERFEDAWRQSPLSLVGSAKTPFLLLQGQDDTVDPPGQAYEMYHALLRQGVGTDLVIYPRENHNSLGKAIYGEPTKEPWHGFEARQRIVDFIDHEFAR